MVRPGVLIDCGGLRRILSVYHRLKWAVWPAWPPESTSGTSGWPTRPWWVDWFVTGIQSHNYPLFVVGGLTRSGPQEFNNPEVRVDRVVVQYGWASEMLELRDLCDAPWDGMHGVMHIAGEGP